jgi:signal transduction histidine kinase
MRERAGLVGAVVEVRNADPAPGVEVRLEVPIE